MRDKVPPRTDPRPAPSGHRRLVSAIGALVITAGLVGVTFSPAGAVINDAIRNHKIHQLSYEQKYGRWDQLKIPGNYEINGIHSTIIHSPVPGWSDAVLIMAGSGNDQAFFDAGTFKTLLLNPATDKMKLIPTPWDAFCAGHIRLPDGNILIAGGTARYENLKPTHAGGSMTVVNTLTQTPLVLPKGTVFISRKGVRFKTAFALTVPRARAQVNADGTTTVVKAQANVWVDAVAKGKASVLPNAGVRFRLETPGIPAYGIGTKMTLAKQDFQGLRDAYIFNVSTLRYQKVNSMEYARWYPTLVTMGTGMVMTMSGLDNQGQIIGNNEWFNPATSQWSEGPYHGFPTYPATFLTMGGQLFFTGSNAGYGPNTPQWRMPGFWNLTTNQFRPVPGIPDYTMLETSASVLLPPAQRQRIMVLGGGGVGQSNKSTARTAMIDLSAADPHWMRGPNMAEPTRYPITVLLPPDQVLVTGGSKYYRGMHGSDNHDTRIYNVSNNSFSYAASSLTGRDYHSGGLLMGDGRVVTLGGNPLFGDAKDTTGQTFNHEIDVYAPPYLFTGTPRPVIQAAPPIEQLGHSYVMFATQASHITSLRLMVPNNPTHVTDVNSRSIAVPFKVLGGNAIRMTLPWQHNLAPPGWYMLFAVNVRGVPSHAYWVHIQ